MVYSLSGSALPAMSPSTGKEWIEMRLGLAAVRGSYGSPSTGKEWIEMIHSDPSEPIYAVSFPWEGVD